MSKLSTTTAFVLAIAALAPSASSAATPKVATGFADKGVFEARSNALGNRQQLIDCRMAHIGSRSALIVVGGRIARGGAVPFVLKLNTAGRLARSRSARSGYSVLTRTGIQIRGSDVSMFGHAWVAYGTAGSPTTYVMRTKSTTAPDRSFAKRGRLKLPFRTTAPVAIATTANASATIAAPVDSNRSEVVKYNVNGKRLSDFGGPDNRVLVEDFEVKSVTVDPRGPTYLSGRTVSTSRATIVKLSAVGDLDAGFGTLGRLDLGSTNIQSTADSVVVQNLDRLLVHVSFTPPADPAGRRSGLVVIDSNGSLQPPFAAAIPEGVIAGKPTDPVPPWTTFVTPTDGGNTRVGWGETSLIGRHRSADGMDTELQLRYVQSPALQTVGEQSPAIALGTGLEITKVQAVGSDQVFLCGTKTRGKRARAAVVKLQT